MLDLLVRRVQEHGGSLLWRTDNERGGASAFVTDPDGYVLQLGRRTRTGSQRGSPTSAAQGGPARTTMTGPPLTNCTSAVRSRRLRTARRLCKQGVRSRVHRAVVSGRSCSDRSARPADQTLLSNSVRRLSANPSSGRRGHRARPSGRPTRPGQIRARSAAVSGAILHTRPPSAERAPPCRSWSGWPTTLRWLTRTALSRWRHGFESRWGCQPPRRWSRRLRAAVRPAGR